MPGAQVERVKADEIDNLLRVLHATSVTAGGTKTSAEVQDDILALDTVGTALESRLSTVRTDAERKRLDSLVARVFATDGCDWDKAHQGKLWALAVNPSEVGLLFKIKERIHRMFCKKH